MSNAVAQDEAVTATNPLIFFCFQGDGKLADVTSLSRRIDLINSDGTLTNKIADTPLDVTATRISQGVYHANFTATAWAAGSYQIVWTYVSPFDFSTQIATQRFEVVDKTKFATGALYIGYASSVDLMKYSPFSSLTIPDMQILIDKSSRRIELLTGRWFEPRFMVFKVDGRGTPGLLMSEPIIGINRLQIESGMTGLFVTLGEFSVDAVRVHARHLQGILDPDDRDNPAIEITRFEGILFQTFNTFPKGPQTIHVTGVFGYTDFDGGPFGKTPEVLQMVVGNFANKFMQDPFGLDRTVWFPNSIHGMKTRDQSITFGNMTNITGQLTGDPIIDPILMMLMRPPHLGSV